jgi:acetylornithine deacetylase/succinyl-diaminopimelate desuccinylase-like protein
VEATVLNADPPAACDPRVMGALEHACVSLDLGYQRMISRAYHDSLFMARIAPSAMVFIPCKDGVSHRPDEFSSIEDIANGVEVLAGALAELAG